MRAVRKRGSRGGGKIVKTKKNEGGEAVPFRVRKGEVLDPAEPGSGRSWDPKKKRVRLRISTEVGPSAGVPAGDVSHRRKSP